MESMCQSMKEDVGPLVKRRLEVEDLSQTCRRDRYCLMCLEAFCSHCCHWHHYNPAFHGAIPVGVDAAGEPTFTKHYPGSGDPIQDYILDDIAGEDYATPLARDAYCLRCMIAFCSDVCHHHHRDCGVGYILRIEERGGRHCVRCRGDEVWFADLESILGDPVADDDDGELMLLPLLRREPGTCAQCGGRVPRPLCSRCSPACAASHDLELAQRRERRDAWRAARRLAKLHIDA
ncbi:hypothetical protein ACP70R_026404 [Stipagrostis hirtigluma subsp. patula]